MVAGGVGAFFGLAYFLSGTPSDVRGAALGLLENLVIEGLVIASLLVVRSCGYRLVPHRKVGQALRA